jgi:hypothetical protein
VLRGLRIERVRPPHPPAPWLPVRRQFPKPPDRVRGQRPARHRVPAERREQQTGPAVRGAHAGKSRRVAHRRQRRGGLLDGCHRCRAMLGQPASRVFVHRGDSIEQQRARDQHTRVAEHQIEVHTTSRNARCADERIHGFGQRWTIPRGVGDQGANAVDTSDRVIRRAGAVDRAGETSRHVREGVRSVGDRRRARSPQVRQCEHLRIATDQRETVERVRETGRAMHHRRRRCERHRWQRVTMAVPGSCEERAEQHALRVVRYVRRCGCRVRPAGGSRLGGCAHARG